MITAKISRFLIESSKREEIDTGDAVELLGDARDELLQLVRVVRKITACDLSAVPRRGNGKLLDAIADAYDVLATLS